MSVANDTSVGQLYNVLRELGAESVLISGQSITSHSQIFTHAFKAKSFEDGVRDFIQLKRFVLELELNVKTFGQGRQVERFRDALTSTFSALSVVAINHNCAVNLNGFRNRMTGNIMGTLASLADYIKDNNLEINVEKDELLQIKNDIESLISNVENSQLNDDFKTQLIINLQKIISEIEKSENSVFFGGWQLRSVLNETTGCMVLNMMVNNAEENNENKDVLNCVWKIILKVNGIFSFVKNINLITQQAPQVAAAITGAVAQCGWRGV